MKWIKYIFLDIVKFLWKSLRLILIGVKYLLTWPWLLGKCVAKEEYWVLAYIVVVILFETSLILIDSLRAAGRAAGTWKLAVSWCIFRFLQVIVAILYYRTREKIEKEKKVQPQNTPKELPKPDLSHIWDPIKTKSEKKKSVENPFKDVWKEKKLKA